MGKIFAGTAGVRGVRRIRDVVCDRCVAAVAASLAGSCRGRAGDGTALRIAARPRSRYARLVISIVRVVVGYRRLVCRVDYLLGASRSRRRDRRRTDLMTRKTPAISSDPRPPTKSPIVTAQRRWIEPL